MVTAAIRDSVSRLNVAIRVVWLWPSKLEPMEFSQPTPFLLRLQLIACQLLLFLNHRFAGAVLCGACDWCCGSRTDRCLKTRSDWRVVTTAFWRSGIRKRVLDDSSLALVRYSALGNIPYLRT